MAAAQAKPGKTCTAKHTNCCSKTTTSVVVFLDGTAGGVRTQIDLRVRSAVLFQLSYSRTGNGAHDPIRTGVHLLERQGFLPLNYMRKMVALRGLEPLSELLERQPF